MCNACGFGCCASDQFDGCGCDDCRDPACWSRCDACNNFVDDCVCDVDPFDDDPVGDECSR